MHLAEIVVNGCASAYAYAGAKPNGAGGVVSLHRCLDFHFLCCFFDPMLYVIRHAPTLWNLQNRMQGWRDAPLAPGADDSVLALASWLRGRQISALFSSDAGRAIATGELLRRSLGLDAIIDPLLRECSYGDCEGLTDAEIDARFPGVRSWRDEDRWLRAFPNGESFQQLFARVDRFLSERSIKRDIDQTQTLMIAHKGSIRAIVASLTGTDPLRGMSLDFDANEVLQFSKSGRDLKRIRVSV